MEQSKFEEEKARIDLELQDISRKYDDAYNLRLKIKGREEEMEQVDISSIRFCNDIEDLWIVNSGIRECEYLFECQRELLLKDHRDRSDFLSDGIKSLDNHLRHLEDKEDELKSEKCCLDDQYDYGNRNEG